LESFRFPNIKNTLLLRIIFKNPSPTREVSEVRSCIATFLDEAARKQEMNEGIEEGYFDYAYSLSQIAVPD
jgi:hypothetical protein